MNNPFSYTPSPESLQAAREVADWLSGHSSSFCQQPVTKEFRNDIDKGKMFGVLVVKAGSSRLPLEKGTGSLHYIAAYSGQVCGRSDWQEFVPAVFDYLQPGGYFKRHEAEISEINKSIAAIASENGKSGIANGESGCGNGRQGKSGNEPANATPTLQADERPSTHKGKLDGETDEEYIRRRQFENAELHRWKMRERKRQADADAQKRQLGEQMAGLKALRRKKSDDLQRWLFRNFQMRNGRGEVKDLIDIWQGNEPLANSEQSFGGGTANSDSSKNILPRSRNILPTAKPILPPAKPILPPAGSGECCEPKLLQYAFTHGLEPVSMAMFWWGESPKQEVRHHLHFYPACNSKCKPILRWMLQGIDVDPNPLESKERDAELAAQLKTIYEDSSICVVDKPAGLLSVPGNSGRESVLGIMRRRYPDADSPLIVHRLDMDTSGLMIIAKTMTAYHDLQNQFANHEIRKRYVAILTKDIACANQNGEDGRKALSGTISLPLRPDLDDRPRQLVDFEHGREAVTRYQFVGERRVWLSPQTGRTHQLRVHCAHRLGLANPILGDPLYGDNDGLQASHLPPRMFLHAEEIVFRHPLNGNTMTFTSKAPF